MTRGLRELTHNILLSLALLRLHICFFGYDDSSNPEQDKNNNTKNDDNGEIDGEYKLKIFNGSVEFLACKMDDTDFQQLLTVNICACSAC